MKGGQFQQDESIGNIVIETIRQEDAVRDTPGKPGGDAREDPTNGPLEEDNSFSGLNSINVVQQNAVVITRKGMKRDQREPDKAAPERWL